MALPTPDRGLVISYSYLWQSEHDKGPEESIKDRPCVIILAIEEIDGSRMVTVAPVTHSPPPIPDAAVEIPPMTKRRLGLDDAHSWVVVSEGNRFVWPGPDLRPITADRFDFRLLPPALFEQIQQRFAAYATANRLQIVPRTE